MTTLRFLTVSLMALAGSAPLAGGGQPPQAPASRLPNIIFIMSDDHAAHAISAYGSRLIKTPDIDRLAAEGMRLSNASSPTRSARPAAPPFSPASTPT